MCRYHWSLLSQPLQRAIFTSYRPGQTVDQKFSPAWLNATEEAQLEVQRLEELYHAALYKVALPTLGQRLLLARHQLGLSSTDLALGLFESDRPLLAIEQGLARPTYQTLVTLVHRLNQPITYFLNPDNRGRSNLAHW